MSCAYPSCMMGGMGCDYSDQCDAEAEENSKRLQERNRLDIEEQMARIAFYKANTPKKESEQ